MKTSVFFLLATFSVCSAQTTITKAFNDPILGDVANNYNVNGTVDNSATGSNVTFSNGNLTQGSAASANYSTPTLTEISTYPGTTIKMVNGSNTIYFKATASKLEITGLITPDATLNFSTNNGTFISYPAAFGYSENDTAAGTFSSPSVSGTFTGNITITADASGTLIVGTKTYTNILRIKSIQNFNLTVGGIPVGTATNTAYTYYDNTHKFPLLSSTTANINVPILGVNQNTVGAQALNETFLAVNDHATKKESFKVYPNPAQDFIELKGDTGNYSSVSIYSLDGKLIKTSDVKSGKVQISELPTANYFIQASGKDAKTETVKFIKK